MSDLKSMLELQKDFVKRFHSVNDFSDDSDLNYWMKQYVIAIISEANELLNEINWKHWKGDKLINRENCKEETIDLLHFILDLAIVLEMDDKEIFERYTEKRSRNVDRQNNGYSEDYKDEELCLGDYLRFVGDRSDLKDKVVTFIGNDVQDKVVVKVDCGCFHKVDRHDVKKISRIEVK